MDTLKREQSLFSMSSKCWTFVGESLLPLHSVTALLSLKILSLSWWAERGRRVCATGLGLQEYTDSGSHIESVDHSRASGPPCWRVQPLSRRSLEKKEEAGFSRNTIVILYSLALLSASLPSREAKETCFWQGSVLLALFHGLMHSMMPVIFEYI